ncbi:hypothetical protein F441_05469 [Phytophthora nicotianae CJ01A1]|uniref:HTH CENPB-type domain-containing protein n=6 Tax=Phytophthora nicotianae TaxID=4792 RepID=W2QHI1_PHYN3|nr:hypothetical protein PPTG_09635 [Phytophthora nicotianae INRA-310]ETI51143.1 hypothetical protein F443_05463 [Phytophthora nicotianae P1569]ETK91043.1 hypothetical protein L915_05319 [Phytophthora nicotianae]ETO79900.1 hypothetical protein F444_05507 [Phytophthora nicotianae P1976]ETP20925.1 hypothetical protein F441_05469 [Phytophthora nicotianae CJ01A1]ETP48858.1 hypothetical protein F442_05511 [Phytophthora nicotianae P10297]KUF92385.1 hypothetical protein AM587_10011673 [Phytophthora n
MSTKGKWLTIEQKCELIAQHRREPAVNYTQLALWAKDHFELSVPPTRQTIRNILNAAADIEAKRVSGNVTAKGRRVCVRSKELENRLEHYVEDSQARGMRLTRRILHARAREILDTMENPPPHNLSVGWLTRFMKRHGLRFQKEREGPDEGEAVGCEPVAQVAGAAPHAGNFQQQPVQGQDAEAERARVENLRQKAKKRLREIEKEAREIRKYLRRLDDATNAQQVLMQ